MPKRTTVPGDRYPGTVVPPRLGDRSFTFSGGGNAVRGRVESPSQLLYTRKGDEVTRIYGFSAFGRTVLREGFHLA